MSEAAAANGGSADINPIQDLGFMYNRNLADPDGHVWEAMWMDPVAIPTYRQQPEVNAHNIALQPTAFRYPPSVG